VKSEAIELKRPGGLKKSSLRGKIGPSKFERDGEIKNLDAKVPRSKIH